MERKKCILVPPVTVLGMLPVTLVVEKARIDVLLATEKGRKNAPLAKEWEFINVLPVMARDGKNVIAVMELADSILATNGVSAATAMEKAK